MERVPAQSAANRYRGFDSAYVALGLMLDSSILRGFFSRVGSVHTNGNSADKALIVCEAFAENHHTFRGDFILANILGVIPAAHLDHHHDLAKLPIDGYIPQSDDVIAKERYGVCTEIGRAHV